MIINFSSCVAIFSYTANGYFGRMLSYLEQRPEGQPQLVTQRSSLRRLSSRRCCRHYYSVCYALFMCCCKDVATSQLGTRRLVCNVKITPADRLVVMESIAWPLGPASYSVTKISTYCVNFDLCRYLFVNSRFYSSG